MGLLRALFLPASLAVLTAAAFLVPFPVYLEQPGEPLSLQERVTVQADEAGDVRGDYLLTTISLLPGTAVRLAQGLVDEQAQLVDAALVTHGESDAIYFDRQRDIFRASADVAAAVGLDAAGFAVDPSAVTGSGVLVGRVLPGAPADGVLEPGDVITAVDGAAVRVADELPALIRAGAAEREIRFRRDDDEHVVRIAPRELPTPGRVRRGIGVEIVTADPRIELPVPVEVDGGRIGGPSAGLMLALTVYDKASPDVDLADGRRVAGTGTLNPTGRVGPIGSIAQKVAAAERAGADVFIAPAVQLREALAARRDGSTLQVIGAATFDEAVAALREGPDHVGRALPALA